MKTKIPSQETPAQAPFAQWGCILGGIMPSIGALLYRLALALFWGPVGPFFCLALWHVVFPSAGAKLCSL